MSATRPASAGSRSTTSAPEITRWRSGLQLVSPPPAGSPAARRRPRRPRRPLDGHHVVEVQTDADEPVGTGAAEGGHDQRQRADEVRGERDEDLALEQRLADQPEVEVLEVAKAAVDELARPARRPAGVVATLEQGDAVAARRGVEGDAGAGDASADDGDVEGRRSRRPARPGPRIGRSPVRVYARVATEPPGRGRCPVRAGPARR